MTSPAITGKANELKEETASVAAPNGAAALSGEDTTTAAKSVSSQLPSSEEPVTAGATGGASVTVLPPEPVQGLDVG